ncbi:muconolactone Delta-isomerase [Streptomyces sp. NPDC058108]|uniref:muconolactone Delta-isomerase n=1 Tax=Streptomyces sp. NPDC058108 TaxID=3346344 RepID=UPI0036EA3CED
MLFHVHIALKLPRDIDTETLTRLQVKEKEVARQLQVDGTWLHLWRVAGKSENLSIFEVADAEQLHEVLSSLPLYPFMELTVTALSRHPGAIATGARS